MDVYELHAAAYELLACVLAAGSRKEAAEAVQARLAAVSVEDVPRLLLVVLVEVTHRHVGAVDRVAMRGRVQLAAERLVELRAAGEPELLADVVPMVRKPQGHP